MMGSHDRETKQFLGHKSPSSSVMSRKDITETHVSVGRCWEADCLNSNSYSREPRCSLFLEPDMDD